MSLTVVVDSTSLICLRELSALDILQIAAEVMKLRIIIPKSVQEEVENPLQKRIESKIKGERIRFVAATQSEFEQLRNRYPRQGRGELEAIAIAKSKRYSNCIVLLDDKSARKMALDLGVPHHGLLWFLIRCFESGALGKTRLLNLLDSMESSGFWVNRELLSNAKKQIKNG